MYNPREDDELNESEVSEALQHLVSAGMCEVSVNEEGEFVFWMTDDQKEVINDVRDEKE